ncbi:MAG: hypothetical protein WCD86_28090 [Ktedonobacteraceae bacterium]
MLPPLLNHASRRNSAHTVSAFTCAVTVPRVNGEVPASLSLALSGGFDAAPSTGLHSPGSLHDCAVAY